jgi:hypothetical protein
MKLKCNMARGPNDEITAIVILENEEDTNVFNNTNKEQS